MQIGVALSGGGAFAAAHIGVLKAFLENNIKIDYISGTSMGSIIGSLYAAGYTPAQMIKFIDEGKLYRVTKLMTFQPAFWKAGLTSQAAIMSLINDLIPNNSFEKLEKPMHICVSNLTTGKYEIIEHSNKLDMWIGASCSIPGIFNGMKINDMMYVVGATQGKMFEDIRKIAPNHFLLVPGVGAQGGSLQEVCQYGMIKDCGLLVNSSRGIIFASNGTDYADVAAVKAHDIQLEMANELSKLA